MKKRKNNMKIEIVDIAVEEAAEAASEVEEVDISILIDLKLKEEEDVEDNRETSMSMMTMMDITNTLNPFILSNLKDQTKRKILH
jgi:hypothetical protein